MNTHMHACKQNNNKYEAQQVTRNRIIIINGVYLLVYTVNKYQLLLLVTAELEQVCTMLLLFLRTFSSHRIVSA